MRQFKQKLAYIVLGGLLVFALQLLSNMIVGQAGAQGGEAAAEATRIKYVFTVDYPLGKKAEYLEWVKSVADMLQAPEEVNRISSYDNYFGGSPHRFIEFEFDNMVDAAKYLEREEISKVFEDVANHGHAADVHVLKLRGDYIKK